MDQNKIKSAVEFLELCQKVARKTNLTGTEVYGLLENFKIKENDVRSNEGMDPLHYFDEWNKYLGGKKNLYVYSWGNYWSGFNNKRYVIDHKFIKIYLSLDREHLIEGVKQLFSYLESENIVHVSKATSHIRTDNVIIRLKSNDYESLKKVCKYIENNKYIQEGINKVNPFLPTTGNIGVMYDDGRSYNSELASLIAAYINTYAKRGSISFSHFAKFVKNEKKDDSIFLETFNQAFFEKGKYQRAVEDGSKQINLNPPSNLEIKSDKDILELAILVAFEKYGKKQAISAISEALKGNYSCFSRVGYDSQGNEIPLRSYLQDNISLDQLKAYISENNTLEQSRTLDDIARNYVDSVIYKHKGCILEDALFATSEKHQDTREWIERRINTYATLGRETMFSSYNEKVRPNYNFRENVINNISPHKMYDTIESILYSKGIEYSTKLSEEKVSSLADIILARINSKKY